MSKYKQIFEKILIVIMSFVSVISINLNLDINLGLIESLAGNSIVYIILFLVFMYIYNKIIEVKEKRLLICAIILSVILALFEVIGYSINTYMDLSGIILTKTTCLKSIIKALGYICMFYAFIVIIYKKIIPRIPQGKNEQVKKRNLFIIWGIIFIAWIPYFLKYYPGITTPDSMDQIYQTQAINILTNHHPIFHTFFIGIAINIGKFFGNYNVGVAIYSISQMLVLSFVFALAVYYLLKQNINKIIAVGILLFYAIYPVFGMYSITMWKDIPFAAVMLLFSILLLEIGIKKEEFWASKRKIAIFVLTIILVILFRNNGIYVVLMTIPFLIILNKKHIKKVVLVSTIAIIFYIILTGPIFSILDIKKGSIREALSVPLQQFARISKDRGNELTEEEKNSIYNYLPVENIAQKYDPKLSDPVKSEFNDEYFSENKLEFLGLWIKLFFRFPVEWTESFLCNNYGYWYPEAQNWVVSRVIADNELNIKNSEILNIKLTNYMDKFIDNRNIPVVSMVFSVGFIFITILTAFTYCIYCKKYNLILVFIPVFGVWLTTIASPVFCEYRYVFSLFTCLPIILSTIIFIDNKKELKK